VAVSASAAVLLHLELSLLATVCVFMVVTMASPPDAAELATCRPRLSQVSASYSWPVDEALAPLQGREDRSSGPACGHRLRSPR
jgi:hypothetical protein